MYTQSYSLENADSDEARNYRHDKITDIANELYQLPMDMQYRVVIEEFTGERSLKQNNLMWALINEAAQVSGHTAKYLHGTAKLEILLPMMLEKEKHRFRAEWIYDILDNVIKYNHKVTIAYDMVRTKDLTKSEFGEYMDRLIRYLESLGVKKT